MTFQRLTSGLGTLLCVVCAFLTLWFEGASAQDASVVTGSGTSPRPRIGLVLAGGGAKGGAHVGVIKVLEREHIPIDCIAGTSMGALVGAGYASGLPAGELETFIIGIDWRAIVGGAGRRSLEPIEQKRLLNASNSAIGLGVIEGRVVTPSGFSDTSAIDDLLRTYVARARAVSDFNKLPIPFRAVSTDMVSGKMIVLDHGDLAMAMRASMAIPGAFAPVVSEGRILADGGMVRNIPVDVAREMCADIVIVVNLVEPETPPEKLVESTQLLVRSMDVMLASNEIIQLETLTDRDIRIDVPMGDIGTADFLRVPETVPLGEAAAQSMVERLRVYAVPEAEYMAWRQRATQRQQVEAKVADVRFEGLKWVNENYLRTLTKVDPGETVTLDMISNDALQMAALTELDSVAYRLEGDPGNTTLVWLPEEASIGRNVLRPSLGIYTPGTGEPKFQVGMQFVRSWMNDRGAQWRNSLELGYETSIATSFYQPFDVSQRYFVEPGIAAIRSLEDVFNDGERVATYKFVDVTGNVDVGMNVTRNFQMRAGYLFTERSAEASTGPVLLPEIDAIDAGITASIMYDSREVSRFATEGIGAAIQYAKSDESLGADRDWERIEAGMRRSVPFGKQVFWVAVSGGAELGDDDLPADRAFSLGGPATLPAYQLDEFRAREYWLATTILLRRLKDLSVRNTALYGGFGLQAAGIYDRVDPVEDGEVYGASLFLAGQTTLGAWVLGVGGASDSWGAWLSFGRPIGSGAIFTEGLFR